MFLRPLTIAEIAVTVDRVLGTPDTAEQLANALIAQERGE